MGFSKMIVGWLFVLFGLVPFASAQEFSLRYFLAKVDSKQEALSKREKDELIGQISRILIQAREVYGKMTHNLQTGVIEMSFQEGDFWLSKLREDQKSIDAGTEQIKLLKEKPNHLVGGLRLFKSLKDLSANFNTYNNIPSFSAFVGDLAPELELWADPVFYQLYLLPLARLKDVEKTPPPKEKKPTPGGKKP